MSGSSRRITVDLETTRLIFVMLKGAKPMRKVAIPITEKTTWAAFQSQVYISAIAVQCHVVVTAVLCSMGQV
jgi:hypothetical protein